MSPHPRQKCYPKKDKEKKDSAPGRVRPDLPATPPRVPGRAAQGEGTCSNGCHDSSHDARAGTPGATGLRLQRRPRHVRKLGDAADAVLRRAGWRLLENVGGAGDLAPGIALGGRRWHDRAAFRRRRCGPLRRTASRSRRRVPSRDRRTCPMIGPHPSGPVPFLRRFPGPARPRNRRPPGRHRQSAR